MDPTVEKGTGKKGYVCMGKDTAYCINTGPSCRLKVESISPQMRLGSCTADLGYRMRREMVFHAADWR